MHTILPPTIIEKTLLIVDDSSMITERLIDALKDHQTVRTILTATNYQEAVDILAQSTPDIMLLDIQLTGKNGIDLLRYIVKEYPHIKVMMFSNLVDENYMKLCKEIGAVHCLDKSADFDKIPDLLLNM